MSVFDEIFGPSRFQGIAKVTELSVSLKSLVEKKQCLFTYEGHIYRITVDEMDVSTIKPKNDDKAKA